MINRLHVHLPFNIDYTTNINHWVCPARNLFVINFSAGKYLRVLIFTVFMANGLTAKIEPTKIRTVYMHVMA